MQKNNASTSLTLLPKYFLRLPFFLVVNLIPQLILFLVNIRAYLLINNELSTTNLDKAHILFLGQFIIFSLPLLCLITVRIWPKCFRYAWKLQMLLIIAYLWYATCQISRIIPANIEPWILSESRLIGYQFAFMMPGLMFSLLSFASRPTSYSKKVDFGISTLLLISPPLAFFLLFLFIKTFLSGMHRFLFSNLFIIIVPFVFICGTVFTIIAAIRCLLHINNHVQNKSPWSQAVFAFIICLGFPLTGLIANIKIPLPYNFQEPITYLLAILNGIALLMPNYDNQLYLKIRYFLRCTFFPFTLYFFITFLPFLPLSIVAMIAFGLGFLILAPTLLFAYHANQLIKDFRCGQKAISITLFFCGISVLPMCFLIMTYADRAMLHQALNYAYSPDYGKQTEYNGSQYLSNRVIKRLVDVKNGEQLPYLSDAYNWLVFDNMILPERKLKYMYKLFSGEELPQQGKKWFNPFDNSRRSMGWRPPITPAKRNVILNNVKITHKRYKQLKKSTIKLTMLFPDDSGTGEFLTPIKLTPGMLITGFRLKVEDEMVAGQIFEKKTALWVYHMIRDFSRKDPGLMYYTTPTDLKLHVYPFIPNQERYLEFDIQYPAHRNSKITIGNKSYQLNNHSESDKIYSIKDNNGTLTIIPADNSFHSFSRTPYLHIILDYSEKLKNKNIKYYCDRINSLKQKFPDATEAIVSICNYNNRRLNDAPIAIDNHNRLKTLISSKALEKQGGFDLNRAVKAGIIFHANTKSLWKKYPIFIAITSDNSTILPLTKTNFFQNLLPDYNTYYISTSAKKLTKHQIIPAYIPQKYIIAMKLTDKINVFPKKSDHVLYWPASSSRSIQLYHPSSSQFSPLPVHKLSNDTKYAQGLLLYCQNIEMLQNPVNTNHLLAEITQKSKAINIMEPSTSFMVVERSHQWKLLRQKERQQLNAANGLEHDETLKTPTPSFWIIMIVCAAVLSVTQRKKRYLTKQ